MAYVKNGTAIKKTLYKALKYITNPDKTDHGTLLTGIGGCSIDPMLAFQQMRVSKAVHNKKDKIQGHHFIQSFDPGEVSPELAHQIAKEWMDELIGDEFEGIISTHVDKGHIHNHIIINSVNQKTGKKFYSNNSQLAKFRDISNFYSRKYGLSVIVPKKGKEKYEAIKNINEERKAASQYYKNTIKDDIDTTITLSKNFDDFILKMEQQGYAIKHGRKHISFKKNEGDVVRGRTLDDKNLYYTEKVIVDRIEKQELFKQYEEAPHKGTVLEIKNFMINKELSTDDMYAIKIPRQNKYFYYPKSETLYVNFKESKILLSPDRIYNTIDKNGTTTPSLSYNDLSTIFKKAEEKKSQDNAKDRKNTTNTNQKYSSKKETYTPYKKYKVKSGIQSFRRFKKYSRYTIPYRGYNIYGYKKPTVRNTLLLILVRHLVEKKYQQAVQKQPTNVNHQAENNIKVLKNNINAIASTLDFVAKNNINSTQDIVDKISSAQAEIDVNNLKIKAIEGQLAEKKIILKWTEEYKELKSHYLQYKATGIPTKESEQFKSVYKNLMSFDIKTEQQIVDYRRRYSHLIEDMKNQIVDIDFENRNLKNKIKELSKLESSIKNFTEAKSKENMEQKER